MDVAVREIQANYDPAVGFVERRGYRTVSPNLAYTLRPGEHPWIRDFEFSAGMQFVTDLTNRPLTRELEFTPFDVNFQDGARFAIDITRQYERLEEDFDISDNVTLPSGAAYEFTRYAFGGSTADHYPVSLQSEVEVGDFFSGRRREYSLELGVRPRPGVALGLEVEHNVLDLAEGDFDADVFRLRANTQFSPWISLVNDVQYDTVSRRLGWQLRFRWIRRPGNDLHLVYTHNWREVLDVGARRLASFDNRLATKIVYTLRF